MPLFMPGGAEEVRLYRGLSALVGAIYLLWWFAVNALLPHAFNPFPSRLAVVVAIWTPALLSYPIAAVRARLRFFWLCGLWILTAHYFFLLYRNAGDVNWIVGAFIVVCAVSLGILSGEALTLYSVFVLALSGGIVAIVPPLRESVFLPGLFTVLLQANIGLHSRLKVIRDLAASSAHFQLLFDGTFEGMLIQEDGRIVQVNDVLVRMLGFTHDELVGRDVLDLVRADMRARAIASDGSEVVVLAKDGSEVAVELRSKPFPGGPREARLVAVRDIGERNRQADALARSNEALEQSNMELALNRERLEARQATEQAVREKERAELASQAKSMFLANMSHELRTPLNAVIGFSEVLDLESAGPLNETQREYVQQVLRSGHHLLRLINDVLDLSKVEAGRLDLAREELSIRDLGERVRASVLPIAEKKGVSLTNGISGVMPKVFADELRMKQVLYNLLSNAIKFTDSGGSVRLEASAHDDTIDIAVRDTGVGIRQEDMPRLFREFEQIGSSQDSAVEGTGLGLALSKKLVELHGGSIHAESALGRGSTFTVTLPIRAREKAPAATASDPVPAPAPASSAESAIVVVDADAASRRLLRDILFPRGHHVLEADSVDAACSLLAEASPALVVVDLKIPGGAARLLGEVRKTPRISGVPVVATTTETARERQGRTYAGFDGWVSKPYEAKEVGPVLEAFLTRRIA